MEIKFLHMADVHLGAEPEKGRFPGIDRGHEIWETFRDTLLYAQKTGVELLLISGDLFHRQPLLRELKEVDYMLRELYTGETVFIAGNHDYLRMDSNYRRFKWNPHVTMLGEWSRNPDEEVPRVCFPNWNLEVYGFSYETREITEPLYDKMKPEDNGRVHILLAHGGDEKHIPMNYGRLSSSPFHYIALGHIHKPGILIPGRAAYSGSPEPIDRTDIGIRGYITGNISVREGRVRVTCDFKPSSRRIYCQETLEVDEDTTQTELRREIDQCMTRLGRENFYCFKLVGKRDSRMELRHEVLAGSGNVICIEDETTPAMHLDRILKEHDRDLVGMYIRSFLQGKDGRMIPEGKLDPMERKALYIGVEAMLCQERE